jgi:two-component system chemotaxis sensor kinase CheA
MRALTNITGKLAIGLLVIVSTVLLGFGYADYQQTQQRLNAELQRDIDIVVTRLQTSLPAPLWNYETDILNRILFSEVKEVFINGMLVLNDSGEATAGVVVEADEIRSTTDIQVDHSEVKNSGLVFIEDGDENPVGDLKLFISDAYIQDILNENLNKIIKQVLLTDLIILVLFYFALKPIVSPLKYLSTMASKIADGDYSETVERRSRDEVGDLSESFDTMRKTIRKKMLDLASINSVGEQLTLTYDRNKALEIVLNSMGQHSKFTRGSIFLKDKDNIFRVHGFYPEDPEQASPRSFKAGEGVLGIAVNESKTIYIENTASDDRFVTNPENKHSSALLCVPLVDGEETIGALNFSGEVGNVVYESGDDEYMESISRSLVITLKNIDMREEIEEHNRNLELKVRERTAALQEKTNDISAMMRNLQQGLFTIREDLTIHPEYSKFLEEILGTNEIADQSFMPALIEGSSLNADQEHQVEASVSSLVGSDEMMWEFNAHILPNEIIKEFNGKQKIIELDWNPILLEDEIDKIMVTVRDVTQLRQLQAEAEEQKQDLEIISQILALESEKFFDFIASSQNYIDKNRGLISSSDSFNVELVQELFRNMHTIKGNARTYGFDNITEPVHHAETTYDELRKSEQPEWNSSLLLNELEQVQTALDHYKSIAEEKLKLGESQANALVSREVLEDITGTLQALQSANQEPNIQDAIEQQLSHLYAGLYQRVDETIQEVAQSLPKLAQAVDKPEPKLELEAPELFIGKETSAMLNDVMMHCLRNSIDHGIESPDERSQSGKPDNGTIHINISKTNDYAEIRISDDGRGLALGKIKEKALANQVIKDGDSVSASDVAELVFHSGLSTAESVTQISGRGVGMDAVRTFLKEHGAEITLDLEKDDFQDFMPFSTVIRIPDKLLLTP